TRDGLLPEASSNGGASAVSTDGEPGDGSGALSTRAAAGDSSAPGVEQGHASTGPGLEDERGQVGFDFLATEDEKRLAVRRRSLYSMGRNNSCLEGAVTTEGKEGVSPPCRFSHAKLSDAVFAALVFFSIRVST
ncbi:unnamed protein product, partial [Ectocarpus sp. 13 AM-2016]